MEKVIIKFQLSKESFKLLKEIAFYKTYSYQKDSLIKELEKYSLVSLIDNIWDETYKLTSFGEYVSENFKL